MKGSKLWQLWESDFLKHLYIYLYCIFERIIIVKNIFCVIPYKEYVLILLISSECVRILVL